MGSHVQDKRDGEINNHGRPQCKKGRINKESRIDELAMPNFSPKKAPHTKGVFFKK